MASAFLVAPVLLILLGVIPFEYRFQLLLIVALSLGAYSYFIGHTLAKLGLRSDNGRSAIAINLASSLILALSLLLCWSGGLIREPSIPEWQWFFPFYVLVSAPSQEFIYRGFFFAEMSETWVDTAVGRVIVSSVLYSFLHIIYFDLLLLGVTLVIGVIWGIISRAFANTKSVRSATYPVFRARELYVHYLAVDPDFRGKGVGIRLLDHAVAKAEGANFTRVSLEVREANLRARQFFRRAGFRDDFRIESEFDYLFGKGARVRMTRDLGSPAAHENKRISNERAS